MDHIVAGSVVRYADDDGSDGGYRERYVEQVFLRNGKQYAKLDLSVYPVPVTALIFLRLGEDFPAPPQTQAPE